MDVYDFADLPVEFLFSCNARATEGSHFSPLTFFSSATLSSSFLALAFAAASFASSLAEAFLAASTAADKTSDPSTAIDFIRFFNCSKEKKKKETSALTDWCSAIKQDNRA